MLGYFLIQAKWDFVLFQVVWELTFIPSLFAGACIGLVAIVKAIKSFERSAAQVLALVLSVGFIAYLVVFAVTIASAISSMGNELPI